MKLNIFKALVAAAVLIAGGQIVAHGADGRAAGGHAAFASHGGSVGRSFSGGSFGSRPSFAYGGHGYGGHGYGGGGYGYRGGYRYGGYGGYRGGYGGYIIGGYGYGGSYPYYYYPSYGYDYYPSGSYYSGSSYGDSSDANNDGSVNTAVQQDLAHEGYYQGKIDGVAGPATQAAISAYQKDNGLTVTGTVNKALLKSMGIQSGD